ncbi:hypothetical protein F4821DRAFT_229019 [Hypoxylon rubiginosum]|uniref:Uncharacterized protein n=1 Tax=Hypoxylon rubiginosum TaxID=110542 RepID=A0ACC0DC16_9PEZI|nr:hypothetical protein F4821DRAFT_229019 [Hypoxylon rubiginosum]
MRVSSIYLSVLTSVFLDTMPSLRFSALALVTSSLVLGSPVASDGFGPTLDSARKNGPQIFNALHNAMREFGSALHHNGMSLFPAVIPEGVTLYHGAESKEVPKKPDWLAFEIEHAEAFARSWGIPRNDTDGNHRPHPLEFVFHAQVDDGDEPPPPRYPPFPSKPGHLHVYQAQRPLNVLYIDGISAGKTDMGTVDTQDILLLNHRNRIPWDDFGRADELCSLAEKWGIDGFIRMEPGFEVIYCDFTNGLRQLSATRRPENDDPGNVNSTAISMFEWARAASQRYQGIGSSRVLLDYSCMLSAFFYPINMANPDPERPELPRLVGASDEELRVMREHITDSVARSLSHKQMPLNWQGVTDMITTRYASRLPLITQAKSIDVLRDEVNHLLNTHIDYSEDDEGFSAAQQRCTEFYLQPVQARTPEDKLIYAAIESTAAAICAALFAARKIVVEDSEDESAAFSAAKDVIVDLTETLSWSEWKECGKCQPDEVCFIAMWPMGDVEDHYNPSCLNYSVIVTRHNYWRSPGKTPGHRPPPAACADGKSCPDDKALGNEEL